GADGLDEAAQRLRLLAPVVDERDHVRSLLVGHRDLVPERVGADAAGRLGQREEAHLVDEVLDPLPRAGVELARVDRYRRLGAAGVPAATRNRDPHNQPPSGRSDPGERTPSRIVCSRRRCYLRVVFRPAERVERERAAAFVPFVDLTKFAAICCISASSDSSSPRYSSCRIVPQQRDRSCTAPGSSWTPGATSTPSCAASSFAVGASTSRTANRLMIDCL